VALELAGEAGLVEEADRGRDLGDSLAGEETVAGGVDAAGQDVLVGGDPGWTSSTGPMDEPATPSGP
jgi:hypothetical protein